MSQKTERQERLLSGELRDILIKLHREMEPERQQLLQQRKDRQKQYDSGAIPHYVTDHPGTGTHWKVAPIPEDLLERRVEITGPVNNAKMVINMLSAGPGGICADMAMVDFEDSMMPSWDNVLSGLDNVIGASKAQLEYRQAGEIGKPDKVYQLDPNAMAHPLVRVRGLHLDESNVLVDGEKISAGLFDLAACAFHSAKNFLARKKTPMYYVPKCEHYLEARWWNTLFQKVEQSIDLPKGTLRTTFLIETLPASFQMEEILFELSERIVALNSGRWDKIFSDIKVLKNHKDKISSNRSAIDMKCSWMDNYAKRLIKICHRHGAFAMGGMSAFTPGRDEETRNRQVEKVLADKQHEADIGHDGCWVSHPFFIDIARQKFTQKNQLEVTQIDFPDQPNLIMKSQGPRDISGLRTNIRVGIAYMEGWNRELGCIALDGLMEDLATLEISRAQVWQWLHHGVILDGGEVVNRDLVDKIFKDETGRLIEELRNEVPASAFETRAQDYRKAAEVARDLFTKKELDEFLCLASPVDQPIEITDF